MRDLIIFPLPPIIVCVGCHEIGNESHYRCEFDTGMQHLSIMNQHGCKIEQTHNELGKRCTHSAIPDNEKDIAQDANYTKVHGITTQHRRFSLCQEIPVKQVPHAMDYTAYRADIYQGYHTAKTFSIQV